MKPAQIPASSAAVCELALASATIRATNSGGAGRVPRFPWMRARRSRPAQASTPAAISRAGTPVQVSGGRLAYRACSSAQVTVPARIHDDQQRPGPGRLHEPASCSTRGIPDGADPRLADPGEQVRDRAVAREYRVRVGVVPGREHERALVRPRVRQREVRVVAALAGHGDDVDIERARPPAHQADPVECRLDLVQPVQEVARRDVDAGAGRRRSGSPAAAARQPGPSRRPATRPSVAPPRFPRWRPRHPGGCRAGPRDCSRAQEPPPALPSPTQLLRSAA